MPDIQTHKASAADVDFIVGANLAMATETEDLGLNRDTLEAGVRYMLAHPEEGQYLIATLDDKPVGTLMTTFEWSDWRNGRFWWIQSVYVLAPARRRGVYRAMHDAVRQLAASDEQACGIRLYVERENTVAQQTYQDIGMVETHYRLYEEAFS